MINIREALGRKPNLEAEILLSYVLHKNRAYLYAHPEEPVSPEHNEAYEKLLVERARGVPIAYLTGEREFWSLNLIVNQHTLIPRHETELLVEQALEKIPNLPNTRILELGTGSGAIALALAKERPKWDIFACDISEEALVIAKKNASRHQITNVHFYHSDWFSTIPQGHYQAIISNPPYIAEQDPYLQEGDLRFEPQNALTSSQEGLADLQLIIKQGYDYLRPGGLILLEHGCSQQQNIKAILKKTGYNNTICIKDLQGHDRVSIGWR